MLSSYKPTHTETRNNMMWFKLQCAPNVRFSKERIPENLENKLRAAFYGV